MRVNDGSGGLVTASVVIADVLNFIVNLNSYVSRFISSVVLLGLSRS